jgi:hypothetical protein
VRTRRWRWAAAFAIGAASGWCLQSLAMVDTAAGRARRAAWLYGAAAALLQSLGATGQVTFSRVQDRYLTLSRDAIGEPGFQEAYDAGRTTPISRIMDTDPERHAFS